MTRALVDAPSLYPLEQLVRRGVAERRIVAEHHELAGRHLAPGGGAIVVEHIGQCLEQELQIILGKAGALDGMRSQWRGNDDNVVRFALQALMAKTETVQIRITPAEKEGFSAAADLAGIPVSSWVRERLRLAAIRELESAGLKIPFVSPIHLRDKQ